MKYRKKPVVIEAQQFDQDTWRTLDEWLTAGGAEHTFIASPSRMSLHIETLEGTMVAHPGDYIIQGVKGEFYPCKEDIFNATYEREDSTSPVPIATPGEVIDTFVKRCMDYCWDNNKPFVEVKFNDTEWLVYKHTSVRRNVEFWTDKVERNAKYHSHVKDYRE